MTEQREKDPAGATPVPGVSKTAAVGRRQVLRSAGAVALGAVAAAAPVEVSGRRRQARAQERKATYVLVHGAWHGGWCWQRVRPLLRAAGHEVHTPTLTGLGDRAHLFNTDIDLDLHVQDVVQMLEMEDLRDIILVGHSYAGIVVSGVAHRAAERIRHLVYLDAFVIKDGMSLADFLPPNRRTPFVARGQKQGYYDPFPAQRFGVVKPDDVAWVKPRLVKQPAKTFLQPLKMTNPAAQRLPRTYIYCTQPAIGTYDRLAAALRKDPSWRFRELATGHDAMVLEPRGLADMLLETA